MFAVSNRQVSEAAGQGNNAAVGYHFGTKTDLVRAIEQKHRASIERLLSRWWPRTGDSVELRDWVACLVCHSPNTLPNSDNPTWYARFAAQAMADPAYHKIVVKDALALAVAGSGHRRHHTLPARPADRRRDRPQHHGPQLADAHLR